MCLINSKCAGHINFKLNNESSSTRATVKCCIASLQNSQNFWGNKLILSPPWFCLWLCSILQVLHHRKTVVYHLVQLKPSKSYELRVSYPSTVLCFELFCFMWNSWWTCGECHSSDHKIQLQAADESKCYVCE